VTSLPRTGDIIAAGLIMGIYDLDIREVFTMFDGGLMLRRQYTYVAYQDIPL
jgi:hypothetical protein